MKFNCASVIIIVESFMGNRWATQKWICFISILCVRWNREFPSICMHVYASAALSFAFKILCSSRNFSLPPSPFLFFQSYLLLILSDFRINVYFWVYRVAQIRWTKVFLKQYIRHWFAYRNTIDNISCRILSLSAARVHGLLILTFDFK